MKYPCDLTADQKRGHVQFLADGIQTKLNELASTSPDKAYKMGLEFYAAIAFLMEANEKQIEPCATTAKNG